MRDTPISMFGGFGRKSARSIVVSNSLTVGASEYSANRVALRTAQIYCSPFSPALPPNVHSCSITTQPLRTPWRGNDDYILLRAIDHPRVCRYFHACAENMKKERA